jgi:hypothetical protein
MSNRLIEQIRQSVLGFTQALVNHEFAHAYTWIGAIDRGKTSPELLEECYKDMIPDDWGPMTHMEVCLNIDDLLIDPHDIQDIADVLPDDQPIDIAWVYVSLAGDEYPYSEALFMLVTLENNTLRVINISFGRP